MVDLSVGPGLFLLNLRKPGWYRRVAIGIAVLFWIASISLVVLTRLGQFYALGLGTICILAWVGGLRTGLLVGLLLPLLTVPRSLYVGIPYQAVIVDTLGFLFIALACGGSIGLLAHLFGYAASAQRELKLFYEILPICSFCQKIRDEDQDWLPIQTFIRRNSNTELTHGICPTCFQEHYPEMAEGGKSSPNAEDERKL